MATSPPNGPTAGRPGPDPQSPGVLSTCPSPAPSRANGSRCRDCGRWIPRPLRRCRRRACPGYAALWAGDQRQKLFANLNAYADQVPDGVRSPRVLVSAVTAPGVEGGMEWDEHHCRALGEHEHSGQLGCRVRASQATAWNESAAERWRDLHRQAYQRCRREGLRPWLLVRVWEIQKRGVLHVHPVFAYSTLEEKRSADRYLEHLAALRANYGFGYVERKQRVREPRAAAAYLSSYFISGKGRKVSLEESVQSNWMPRSIVHVSAKLTQRSRVTMRSLRLKRFIWRELPTALDLARCLGITVQDVYAAWRMGIWGRDLVHCLIMARAP